MLKDDYTLVMVQQPGDSLICRLVSPALQCSIGVAFVAMQIQLPSLLIQVSMKRSRWVTDLPPLVSFTAITPIAMAVFPKTEDTDT